MKWEKNSLVHWHQFCWRRTLRLLHAIAIPTLFLWNVTEIVILHSITAVHFIYRRWAAILFIFHCAGFTIFFWIRLCARWWSFQRWATSNDQKHIECHKFHAFIYMRECDFRSNVIVIVFGMDFYFDLSLLLETLQVIVVRFWTILCNAWNRAKFKNCFLSSYGWGLH